MSGYPLKCQKGVIDTKPFKCDRIWKVKSWNNNLGMVLRIRQIQIWFGMAKDGVADFPAELMQMRNGQYIQHFGHDNWDHYEDPTNHHFYRIVFAPDWMVLEPGDDMVLLYAGFPFPPSTTDLKGHLVVTIWYIDEQAQKDQIDRDR